jgi:hypothetical protein
MPEGNSKGPKQYSQYQLKSSMSEGNSKGPK